MSVIQATQGEANGYGLTDSHGTVGEAGAVEDLLLVQLAQHLGLAQVGGQAAGADALHDLAAVTLQHVPEHLLVQSGQRGIRAAQFCHTWTLRGWDGVQSWTLTERGRDAIVDAERAGWGAIMDS